MATVVIPSLTVDGNITNKDLQMKKLFQYFLASDYSQSNQFYGKIASLKYILATYTDSTDISLEIKRVLNSLYADFFDSVSVTVSIQNTTTTGITVYNINISCIYDSTTYELAQSIDSSLAKIENYDAAVAALFENYNI